MTMRVAHLATPTNVSHALESVRTATGFDVDGRGEGSPLLPGRREDHRARVGFQREDEIVAAKKLPGHEPETLQEFGVHRSRRAHGTGHCDGPERQRAAVQKIAPRSAIA